MYKATLGARLKPYGRQAQECTHSLRQIIEESRGWDLPLRCAKSDGEHAFDRHSWSGLRWP
eukprot:10612168-Lingulodinium_polyedra.AAC.1